MCVTLSLCYDEDTALDHVEDPGAVNALVRHGAEMIQDECSSHSTCCSVNPWFMKGRHILHVNEGCPTLQ